MTSGRWKGPDSPCGKQCLIVLVGSASDRLRLTHRMPWCNSHRRRCNHSCTLTSMPDILCVRHRTRDPGEKLRGTALGAALGAAVPSRALRFGPKLHSHVTALVAFSLCLSFLPLFICGEDITEDAPGKHSLDFLRVASGHSVSVHVASPRGHS